VNSGPRSTPTVGPVTGPARGRGTRPFRFSLQAAQAGSRSEWVELARRAEDAGFDLLVTPDHLGGPLAPVAALATAAQATERLRVGTMVLNNDFHHPVLLARDAATLDLLSDGRAELGLGAGHARPEYEHAGIAFDPPGTRVARLEESVRVLRSLLDGEVVTHWGDHYAMEEARCDPRPTQAHLPLLVGGGGSRVLAIGARLADAVGFTGLGRTLEDGQRHEPSGFAPRRVDEQVAVVRAAAGERWESLELQVLVQRVVITEDPTGAAEAIQGALPGLSVEDILATPYLMVGPHQAVVERLLHLRERWGFSHYTVRADALGAVAPLVATLAGR
jgi:probable F420-dependent oxidoreductase